MVLKSIFKKISLCAAVLCPLLSGAAAGEQSGDALQAARRAAAADRHEVAIRYYLEVVRADTSLASKLGKEIGLQYTWSDKPDSAVIWFRRYLRERPDEIDGMLGLARALSWADRKAESLRLYRRIQGRAPESVDARVGEARVVSWQDDSAEAEVLYRKILSSYPDNLQARLGLAQVVNWQGRHREARSLYLEILKSDPESEEAVIGLALSERWLGLDWKARERLSGLAENEEACRILGAIERETSPRIRAGYVFSSDSDDLDLHRVEISGSGQIADGALTGAEIARIWMFQDKMPSVKRTDLIARFMKRFNEDWSVNLNLAWSRHSVDRGDPAYMGGDGFEFISWDGWLTWTPHRRIRVDFSSNRSAVETPLSVQREILHSGAGAGADFLIREGLKAVAGYEYRSYSDDNRRNLIKSSLIWRLLSSPFRLELVPGYTCFSFQQWQPNGYYSPDHYHNLGLKLLMEARLRDSARLILEGRGSAEKEDNGDFFSVGTFRAALQWSASKDLDLGAEFFTSNSRVSGEAGYSRTLGGIYLAWIF